MTATTDAIPATGPDPGSGPARPAAQGESAPPPPAAPAPPLPATPPEDGAATAPAVSAAVSPAASAAQTAPTARPQGRLIQNEATTEIPVHLLFRDDPAAGARPAAVARVGTAGATGAIGPQRPPRPSRRRPAPLPAVAADVDPGPEERAGRALPGALGVLAGAVGVAGGALTTWWAGAVPPAALEFAGLPAPGGRGTGLGPAQWAVCAGSAALGLFGFGGLTRGTTGRAWVLGMFGRYRGTVRRTGLLWVNPLLLRHRVDVRLRHWRSEPLCASDPNGVALRVRTLVVWRVKDTARAVHAVEDHEEYLRRCVEAALARIPVDPPMEPADERPEPGQEEPGLEEALTGQVAADARAVGLEVFAVRPIRVEYAPEVAAVMQRRRIAALDARQRAGVLSAVVDSVEDTVNRLTLRGLVELDDYERKVLVKDLTVAFCAGRGESVP
ncbi:SPFH domain-containing protein [Streptomyces chilikensis]|uniref:SPFH domain-containing protein n=1 Tax=Streptomyces chilikensis TaxID=1194079 RepID=A0ABV3EZB5_9ACTN